MVQMTIERGKDADEANRILKEAESRFEDQLVLMRDVARKIVGNNQSITVGVNGSVARREMANGSDVALFFLTLGETEQFGRGIKDAYRASLTDLGKKMPAHAGCSQVPGRMPASAALHRKLPHRPRMRCRRVHGVQFEEADPLRPPPAP